MIWLWQKNLRKMLCFHLERSQLFLQTTMRIWLMCFWKNKQKNLKAWTTELFQRRWESCNYFVKKSFLELPTSKSNSPELHIQHSKIESSPNKSTSEKINLQFWIGLWWRNVENLLAWRENFWKSRKQNYETIWLQCLGYIIFFWSKKKRPRNRREGT